MVRKKNLNLPNICHFVTFAKRFSEFVSCRLGINFEEEFDKFSIFGFQSILHNPENN